MNDRLDNKTVNRGQPHRVIKSAGRTLAVLEAFQTWKRPATAREVARELDIPRSSTNALLASMVALGYLWFEAESTTYFPTLKVGLLGDWLIGSVRRDQTLSNILHEISTRTGETVSTAVRAGFDMQFITIVPSTFPVALNIAEGTVAPIFESAVGMAWMAAQTPNEIDLLLQAHNRQRAGAETSSAEVFKRIASVGVKGAAVAYGKVLPDTGAIGLAYPKPIQGQTIVVGVGGPEDRIRRSESQIISLIQRLFRHSVG